MKSSYAAVEPYITRDGSEIRELMHPSVHGNRAQSLAEATVPAGATTLLHRHALTEEIYHFVSGEGVMTLGAERFAVRAGDTIAIAPGGAEIARKRVPAPRGDYAKSIAAIRDLVLDIDVQGARQLKERIPTAVTIFILPPSRTELESRLRARSQDAEEVIVRRLREAAEEIRNYSRYDYVVVNKEVDASVDKLVAIVNATRSRRERMDREIRPILETFEHA